MGNELWNRLQYVLSPQFDIYEQLSYVVRGIVADIGCGTGFGTQLLTRSADKVVGYEVDPNARNFAHRAFSNEDIHFYVADIVDGIGVSEGFYDFVTMVDVIEHIEADTKALVNCAKLLKDTGTFFCSTPNTKSRYRKSENHVREYSPDELTYCLSSVFSDVQIVNYKLNPMESTYENPIVARCQK